MDDKRVAESRSGQDWTRPDDYVTALARRRTARKSRGPNPKNQHEASRFPVHMLPCLALMAVQHVEAEGWRPSLELGKTYGSHAAANAAEVGFPAGVNVWLDLEGVNHQVSAEDVIAYCNAWHREVAAAGYAPGIYVGASAILTGDQLYWRLRMRHYWKSGSSVPSIPERGYQLVQRIVPGDVVAGIAIDRNVTKTDSFGGTVRWLTRAGGPVG